MTRLSLEINQCFFVLSLLTSPRGITAARPPFCFLRLWAELLCFIDLSDFCALSSAAALGALHVVLGRSWLLLGFLERTWPNLTAKTAKNDPQMASWGGLGMLLGTSWAVLLRQKRPSKYKPISRAKTEACVLVFGPPFGTQNPPKMPPKTGQNLKGFSKAKKLLSKTLLEPSWAELGAFRRPSWALK